MNLETKNDMKTDITINRFDLFGAAYGLMNFAECGLLRTIRNAPMGTAYDYANICHLDTRATSLLLELVAEIGVLDRHEDGQGRTAYALSEPFKDLDQRVRNLGFDVKFWDSFDPFLHTGKQVMDLSRDTERASHYFDKANRVDSILEPLAKYYADRFPVSNIHQARVLDLGCGTGVWTRYYQGAAVIDMLDLPEVIDMNLHLYTNPVAKPWKGNWRTELDHVGNNTYDRIVLANILHLEDEEIAKVLIKKCRRILKHYGELLIIGSLGEEGNSVGRALYDISLAMRSTSGVNHRIEKINRWCQECGMILKKHSFPQIEPRSMSAFLFSKERE